MSNKAKRVRKQQRAKTTRKAPFKVKRTFKDAVFRGLFKQPENALSLCNALLEIDQQDTARVEIVNLDGAVLSRNGLMNDLGIQIGNKFLLICEHQSIPDRYAVWRAVKYYVLTVCREEKFADLEIDDDEDNLLPGAYLFEILLGEPTEPAVQRLELNDLMPDKPQPFINAYLMRYNVNNPGCPLLKDCPELAGYVEFVRKAKELKDKGASDEDAVSEAINYCIENNFIRDYLISKRAEVSEIMPIQLSDEQYQKMYRKEGRLEGRAEGRAEGRVEGRVEGESMIQRLINAMKDAGKAVEDIFNEISDSAKLPGLYKQYGITA